MNTTTLTIHEVTALLLVEYRKTNPRLPEALRLDIAALNLRDTLEGVTYRMTEADDAADRLAESEYSHTR